MEGALQKPAIWSQHGAAAICRALAQLLPAACTEKIQAVFAKAADVLRLVLRGRQFSASDANTILAPLLSSVLSKCADQNARCAFVVNV
jgi:hypothetical protein